LRTVEKVILVTENDEAIGSMEKMEAHRAGLLHRAFSVFIFNSKGEMLLQQRAINKYHSGGLWTNTCCSHPRPGEDVSDAAHRRLFEEMGFSTDLHKIFDFIYRSEYENGLTEFEFDHVFAGSYDDMIFPSSSEVMDYCYKSMNEIKETLSTHPKKYTTWFRIAFPKIEAWAREHLTPTEMADTGDVN
jgi:isopentenyl-diphosphate Delta-isomerase